MTRVRRKAAVVLAVGCLVMAAVVMPSLTAAQGSGKAQLQLQGLIQVGESGRAYATGVIGQASSLGLETASAQALWNSGNQSLTTAESDLASDTSLATGAAAAEAAASDFTSAAASASAALSNEGFTYSVDLDATASAIISVNQTASMVLSIMVGTCADVPANSTAASIFLNDCSTGKAEIGGADASLTRAAGQLAVAGVVGGSANLTVADLLVGQARISVSEATQELQLLSAYSYSARASVFVSGPLADMATKANRSVSLQQGLASQFDALASDFQNLVVIHGSSEDNVIESGIALGNAVAGVDSTVVVSNLGTEQGALGEAESNLTAFYQQLPSGLPADLLAGLEGNITATESSLTTLVSSVTVLSGEASGFQIATAASLGGYSSGFQAGLSAAAANGDSFLVSYARLQSDLGAVVGLFPIPSLVAWQTELTRVGPQVSSSISFASLSTAEMDDSLVSMGPEAVSLNSSVLAASVEMPVSPGFVANASSILVSENAFLNSSGLSAIGQSIASLNSSSSLASQFVVSAQGLLKAQFASYSSVLAEMAKSVSSLEIQDPATVNSVTLADAYIQSDVRIRAQEVVTAQGQISEALTNFDDLQVPLGGSLFASASLELQAAYSVSP